MKLYISGAMSGLPNNNFDAFDEAEHYLKAHGYEVVNPANINRLYPELDSDTRSGYQQLIRHDLKALLGCDAIFLLRGWSKSRGANIELFVALAIGLRVIYQNGAEPRGVTKWTTFS